MSDIIPRKRSSAPEHRSEKETVCCSCCGSEEILPIIYGYPNDLTIAESEQGVAILGGCMVWEGMPVWHCNKCEMDFNVI
jgi:hypothetical protein